MSISLVDSILNTPYKAELLEDINFQGSIPAWLDKIHTEWRKFFYNLEIAFGIEEAKPEEITCIASHYVKRIKLPVFLRILCNWILDHYVVEYSLYLPRAHINSVARSDCCNYCFAKRDMHASGKKTTTLTVFDPVERRFKNTPLRLVTWNLRNEVALHWACQDCISFILAFEEDYEEDRLLIVRRNIEEHADSLPLLADKLTGYRNDIADTCLHREVFINPIEYEWKVAKLLGLIDNCTRTKEWLKPSSLFEKAFYNQPDPDQDDPEPPILQFYHYYRFTVIYLAKLKTSFRHCDFDYIHTEIFNWTVENLDHDFPIHSSRLNVLLKGIIEQQKFAFEDNSSTTRTISS